MTPTPIGPTAMPPWADELAARAGDAADELPAALDIARDAGHRLPAPGTGATRLRWAVLAAISAGDLSVGRIVEAHTDALAILQEAGEDITRIEGTWGVFASEAPDHRVEARTRGGRTTLHGVKGWCSLGDVLDHALVTAHVDGGRRLFRVDLHHCSVHPEPVRVWVARGLRAVTSGPVAFDGTPGDPVGDVDWYLRRPGFAWGGIGVAACWHGGAAGLAATLRRTASGRAGELNAMHVGLVDAAQHASITVLEAAAAQIDAGAATGPAGALLAARVRAVVAAAAEQVMRQVGHALGPAPLAFDARHAARVADLTLYLRQHHAERDLAELGTTLLEGRL